MSISKFLAIQRDVRDIVGSHYDDMMGGRPERYQVYRLLTITAIPGAYEFASHVVIAISGTPTRGAVIVQLTHGDHDSRHLTGNRRLVSRDLAILNEFIAIAAGTALTMVPAKFNWESEP